MAKPKRKLREAVLVFIFSSLFSRREPQEMHDILMQQLKLSKNSLNEALIKAQAVYNKKNEIVTYIEKTSNDYKISRICKVELSILYLSIFELLFEKLLPPEIIISEGIRLARKFSSKESANFIHAILDAIIKSSLH